ncbi:hypothetical protein D3C86_1092010 [compost metagenome]
MGLDLLAGLAAQELSNGRGKLLLGSDFVAELLDLEALVLGFKIGRFLIRLLELGLLGVFALLRLLAVLVQLLPLGLESGFELAEAGRKVLVGGRVGSGVASLVLLGGLSATLASACLGRGVEGEHGGAEPCQGAPGKLV